MPAKISPDVCLYSYMQMNVDRRYWTWCLVKKGFSATIILPQLYIGHYILVGEVKNSTNAKLLSFNTTNVFLYDVMVSENDVLEAR